MGFDGFYFARMSYDNRQLRRLNKTMEMIWNGDPSQGGKASLMTGALYKHYDPPPAFCFDQNCNDSPIQVHLQFHVIVIHLIRLAASHWHNCSQETF